MVRPPSRLVFDRNESPTLNHDSVATPPQPVNVRSDVHRPVNLHAVSTLVANRVYTLVFKMAAGRVVVVGEVLLVMDDGPLARTVDPVLDFR